VLMIAAIGCSSSENRREQEKKDTPSVPVVTDERTDLIYSWFADGGSRVASSVSEVSSEARSEVRVQDPTVPPENRDARWIFLADLTAPDANGRYPVRAEPRSKYEAERQREKAVEDTTKASALAQGSAQMPLPPLGSAAGSAGVIMYATRHCPVCKNARRWLLAEKIPYVEKDVELDANAAQELAKKGQAQGVATSGVPVFDIGGRLVPGFEPEIIKKLWAAMPKSAMAI
jgi:glutaredoxin